MEGVKDTAPGSLGEILMAGGAADGPAHRASLVLQDGLRPVVGGGGKEGGGRCAYRVALFDFSIFYSKIWFLVFVNLVDVCAFLCHCGLRNRDFRGVCMCL